MDENKFYANVRSSPLDKINSFDGNLLRRLSHCYELNSTIN